MRVLFAAVVCVLPVSATADPVEITGRFLIEHDRIAALPGAPDPSDGASGGVLDGTWVVDWRGVSREALVSGAMLSVAPLSSGFTVSVQGQALYGEVLSHSRVQGWDAPARGLDGDRIVVEAFTEGGSPDTRDSVRLVLTGPADWFETTRPGATPDLGLATVTFEGTSKRGAEIVRDRAGTALGPLQIRHLAPVLPVEAEGEMTDLRPTGHHLDAWQPQTRRLAMVERLL
jgi:hypothetical protein